MKNNNKLNPWDIYFTGVEITIIEDPSAKTNINMEYCYLNIIEKKLLLPYKDNPEIKQIVDTIMAKELPLHVTDINGRKITLLGAKNTQYIKDGCIIAFSEIIFGGYFNDNVLCHEMDAFHCLVSYQNCYKIKEYVDEFSLYYDDTLYIKISYGESEHERTVLSIDLISDDGGFFYKEFVDIIDYLYLFIGVMPTAFLYTIMVEGEQYTISQDPEKMRSHTRTASNKVMLQRVNAETFTTKTFKAFKEYKNEYPIVYASFLDAANSNLYLDLSCVRLIQALDGLARYVNPEYKNDESIERILKNFIGANNDFIKNIFKGKEKELKKFRRNLALLRNYHSHYNKEYIFEYNSLDYFDLKFKLSVLLRIMFLQAFEINIDEELYNEVIASIEKFEKDNGVDLMKNKIKNNN